MLNEKSMLVNLKTSKWSARAHDRAVSERVTREAKAVDGVGSFDKRMLSSAALAPVTEVLNRARSYHKTMTVPWDDSGMRLLPVRVFEEYKKIMDAFVIDFGDQKNKVIEEYPYWRQVAEKELGDLYDASEYPSEKDLADSMNLDYEITPIPDTDHIVLELDRQSVDEVKAKLDKANAKRIGAAMQSLYYRVSDIVDLCVEKLEPNEDGSEKIIRESVLDKMRQVAEVVPQLNVVDDDNLAKLADDLRSLVDGVTAKQLRKKSDDYDADKKAEVKETLIEMQEKMGGLY